MSPTPLTVTQEKKKESVIKEIERLKTLREERKISEHELNTMIDDQLIELFKVLTPKK